MVKREHRLHMLLSEQEQRQLQELAEHAGLTASDYVRQFVRREHAAAFDGQKTKTKRRTPGRGRARSARTQHA
jgi:hypothetical protein